VLVCCELQIRDPVGIRLIGGNVRRLLVGGGRRSCLLALCTLRGGEQPVAVGGEQEAWINEVTVDHSCVARVRSQMQADVWMSQTPVASTVDVDRDLVGEHLGERRVNVLPAVAT
jgi:hypothetical protein